MSPLPNYKRKKGGGGKGIKFVVWRKNGLWEKKGKRRLVPRWRGEFEKSTGEKNFDSLDQGDP